MWNGPLNIFRRRALMKRTTLIALASAGLAFAATPSFAQSSYGGNTGQNYGNSSKSKSKSRANADQRRHREAAERAAKFEKIKADALKAEAAEAEAKKKAREAAERASKTRGHSSAKKYRP